MRYIDWWLTLTLTIPQVQFFYYLVTSGSDLPVRTIRCCSVVFSVTSSLAVIHTIRGRQWMCIARDRAWWVSRCTQSRTTVTVYSVSRLVVQYPHAVNGKLVPKCKIQTRVQQLLIAKPNIRWESTYLHSRPPLGGSHRTIAIIFGTGKLEWCGYPMLKTFRRYLYSFWQNVRTWRTDGHCMMAKAALYASGGKNVNGLF